MLENWLRILQKHGTDMYTLSVQVPIVLHNLQHTILYCMQCTHFHMYTHCSHLHSHMYRLQY